jgi:pyruvate carboxylase subunit B
MDVQAGGQTLRVDVHPDATGLRIGVGTISASPDHGAARAPLQGDAVAHVRIAPSGAGVSMLLAARPDAPVARSHDVVVVRGGPGEFVVYVSGRPVVVRLPHLLPRASSSAARAAGAQHVVAGIPGRIVRVLVRPGDPVAARQPVIVIEAMKMQNELRATHAGIVAAVHVAEGALVEAGARLVDIGPPPS